MFIMLNNISIKFKRVISFFVLTIILLVSYIACSMENVDLKDQSSPELLKVKLVKAMSSNNPEKINQCFYGSDFLKNLDYYFEMIYCFDKFYNLLLSKFGDDAYDKLLVLGEKQYSGGLYPIFHLGEIKIEVISFENETGNEVDYKGIYLPGLMGVGMTKDPFKFIENNDGVWVVHPIIDYERNLVDFNYQNNFHKERVEFMKRSIALLKESDNGNLNEFFLKWNEWMAPSN